MKKNKKVPATVPRNYVAKNAPTSGAGSHKDLKRSAKCGAHKHKGQMFKDDGSFRRDLKINAQ